jgi:hypothetical protein
MGGVSWGELVNRRRSCRAPRPRRPQTHRPSPSKPALRAARAQPQPRRTRTRRLSARNRPARGSKSSSRPPLHTVQSWDGDVRNPHEEQGARWLEPRLLIRSRPCAVVGAGSAERCGIAGAVAPIAFGRAPSSGAVPSRSGHAQRIAGRLVPDGWIARSFRDAVARLCFDGPLVGTSSPSISVPAADGCRLSARTPGVGAVSRRAPSGVCRRPCRGAPVRLGKPK